MRGPAGQGGRTCNTNAIRIASERTNGQCTEIFAARARRSGLAPSNLFFRRSHASADGTKTCYNQKFLNVSISQYTVFAGTVGVKMGWTREIVW